MLSCFMCGRSGSVIQATTPHKTSNTPHKLSPSLEEKNLSKDVKGDHQLLMSITKSHLNVSSDVKDGDLKLSALAKNKNPTSLKHATSHNSAPRDNGSVCAFSLDGSDCYTTQKDAAISTIVVEGHTEECSSNCTRHEVEPDEYSTEDAELVGSSDESCSEVRNKDLISSRQDVFGKDATVNAGNELLSCRYQLLENNNKPHYRIVNRKSPHENILADADGEITINANPKDEDTSPTTVENAEKPLSQLHNEALETTGIVSELMDKGYYTDNGVKTYKHKQPARLFSYGISDQQRDFLFLCAGLVIQGVGFQLKSIVEVVTTLILVGYRTYFFASRLVDSLSHMKERLTEAHTKLLSYVVTQDHRQSLALHMEKLETMKPLLITGAKKMGWGCITAAYMLALLIALLFISFIFSYFAVKGSSRQAPLHITKELFFDYTKSDPVASLDLLSLGAYHKSNASEGGKLNAMARVQYRSTLILTLPESDYNRKLGIFQVTSELLSKTGDILSKASKPCMLHFKSNTLHYVKSICLAVPLIAGVTSETQTLSLQLIEWQQDAASRTNASVLRILLEARAGRPISNGLPELYKAEIQVDSYWMTSSATGSSIRTLLLWVGLSFMLFGVLSTFCMYKIHQNRNNS